MKVCRMTRDGVTQVQRDSKVAKQAIRSISALHILFVNVKKMLIDVFLIMSNVAMP